MQLQSEAFTSGSTIPKRYTADGEDVSPPLSWSGLPKGTEEVALVCDDPDAPTDEPFVHWLAYKLSPDDALPEGVLPQAKPGSPPRMVQGMNSFGRVGYGGPAPPSGHGTHHYHFKLYALDTQLDLNEAVDKAALMNAIKGHTLAETELVGTYER
jgi:hypothetical protein